MVIKGYLKKAMTAVALVAGMGAVTAPAVQAQSAYSYTDGVETQSIDVYGAERGYFYPPGHPLAPYSAEPVDVRLVLVFDSSISISPEEYAIQIEIMAKVIGSERIQHAWFGIPEERSTGAIKSIAMTLVDFGCWADIRIPWVDFRYDDPQLAERITLFTDEIRKLKEERDEAKNGCTEIGGMLDFVKDEVLPNTPWETRLRSIVDVISDGKYYFYAGAGMQYEASLDTYRQALAEMGVTINALAIVNEEPNLDDYYDRELRTQLEDIPEGSRVMVGNVWAVARDLKEEGNSEEDVDDLYEEAEDAFYRKIVWEVALLEVGPDGVLHARNNNESIQIQIPYMTPEPH